MQSLSYDARLRRAEQRLAFLRRVAASDPGALDQWRKKSRSVIARAGGNEGKALAGQIAKAKDSIQKWHNRIEKARV